ncbi:hypothetical protein QL093DRAFT_2220714 [Fusarium oxysporum]|nr:hypothetical protein QL093DRAFT_2220714 [Fusarium oxysporum]
MVNICRLVVVKKNSITISSVFTNSECLQPPLLLPLPQRSKFSGPQSLAKPLSAHRKTALWVKSI